MNKKSVKKIPAYLALVISALFSVSAFAADSSPANSYDSLPKQPEGMITNRMIADAPLASDYVLGAKDAPVVIIEYASLSCPHCAAFYNSIMPDIQKNYIDTGKVRFILRQFPLNLPALKGAMLVNCVGEENSEKYYMFNKVLFDAQSRWAFDGDWRSSLEKIAVLGGVSKEKFAECIDSKEREEAVLQDKQVAMNELMIPHTPYLFIGGEAYNGDKTFADIAKFIDSKLLKK